MTLVVDSPALAAWLLPHETGAGLVKLIAGQSDVLAPWLFWTQLRNILIVAERRGRRPQGLADQLIEAVEGLETVVDTAQSSAAVLAMARQHAPTVYNALFVELTLRRRAMLKLLDAKQAPAARAEGVIFV